MSLQTPQPKPRILTDLAIPQSPLWAREAREAPRFFPRLRASRILRRFESAFRALDLFLALHDTDVVVTADLRVAQLFGFFAPLLGPDRPKHVVLELILAEKRGALLGKLREQWLRLCFRGVALIFVSSRGEENSYPHRLALPSERVRYAPFHTNFCDPLPTGLDEGYVFSGGRSGRDFATLASALAKLRSRAVVVAPRAAVEGIKFSSNVELRCDIPYAEYLSLLARARVVAVPLLLATRSTGQVVILEAMALGKPVVATATMGTIDYIESGRNGVLVAPGDANALGTAIEELMETAELRHDLANAALTELQRDCTVDAYVQRILSCARELTAIAPAQPHGRPLGAPALG